MLTDQELKQIWEASETLYDALQAAAKLGASKEKILHTSPHRQAVERMVDFYRQRESN